MTNLWAAFEARAAEQPNAWALVLEDTHISFAELLQLALQAAAALRSLEVARFDVVALQLPKRLDAYALLLGCLRIGAPYVFIDPKQPPRRMAQILDRVRPALLFAESEAANPYGSVQLLSQQHSVWLNSFEPIDVGRPCPATGSDPAYIMFTSGSTGEPKGAVIPHHGVLHLIDWARRSGNTGPSEVFTGLNPLHFDNSVFDIYCSLFNGAALLPIETGRIANPASWARIIRTKGATVMFAVPTLFLILDQLGLLTPEALPQVRRFQFGGEGYPPKALARFAERFGESASLVNVYGPTETSCICSSIRIDRSVLAAVNNTFAPLGRMHEGFNHLVLREDGSECERGEAGELWIGGPCVGLGYYANPEETDRRFVQNPTQNLFCDVGYRTGDLVEEDERGWLWFRGRIDNQVKIRGHRIELEEIDVAVQSVKGVGRALATVASAPHGDELVIAFSAERRVSEAEIMEVCSERLPAYMRPARVVQVQRLPVNANGKVDRRAVREMLRMETDE